MMGINPLEKEWEKQGLSLREYQREGVIEMDSWYRAGHGGINGDEMGLGKTCQAIVQMLRLKEDGKGPFLVVCPLSVCDHWMSEVARFSCGTLNPVGYYGYEAERAEVLKKLGKLERNTVFIAPYHVFRQHSALIDDLQEKSKLKFEVVIVDEAHAIKNSDSQLAESLKPYRGRAWFLLMTGTPIQNHLGELYALFTFVDPKRFADQPTARSDFVARYKNDAKLPELRMILSQYLIRRTKDVVCKELPSCEQVIIYHNLTEIQKKLYLDIIAKDYDSLLTTTSNNTQSLINIQMQLRKCVSHPYLFKGVEPEPFEEGEHIVEASGKLQVLDRLLRYLKERKHRCLIFSQFVIVLDIVQDFMNLRGYNYERLDGSVRAEERFEAINEFQNAAKNNRKRGRRAKDDGPWCFLLTTRSGGVGLNLTGADTVIFLDADWNPQNDIQAMARCHRIGQDKPVRVIRLIGRYTVEQHMNARIRDKLKFTDKVMGNEEIKLSAVDMLDMIKKSLGTLKEQKIENYQLVSDQDLECVIGQTNRVGEWMPMKGDEENQIPATLRLDPDEVDKRDTDYNDYRVFQGRQFRVSAKDEAAFEELRLLKFAGTTRRAKLNRFMGERSIEGVENDEEIAEKIKKAEEYRAIAAEKRRKAAEEKKEATWTANGYQSNKLPPPVGTDQNDEIQDEVEEGVGLFYVHGDVTKPQKSDDDRTNVCLILHCVDNSGKFGKGGIFSALRAKDPTIAERYELISRMGDMKMGDCHLVEDVKELRGAGEEEASTSSRCKEDVVLFVALSSKHRDDLRPALLEQCFTRIAEYARQNNASVHMARIGYGTSLSWYTVERLLKKCFTNHGIPTYIYYFARHRRPEASLSPQQTPAGSSKRPNQSPRGPNKRPRVAKQSGSGSDDEEEEEKEEEDDDSSSASSSASEHDWSEGDEETSDDEAISSSEDEVDDEELKVLRAQHEDLIHDVIVHNGGYVVSEESELVDVTHAVVPPEILESSSKFSNFRKLFPEDCLFIEETWFSDCVKSGKRVDTVAYDVCK
ncbi:Chromodomain helicase DNA binding protein 1 like [Trichostrongylus colubriformis]|uniref:Chromodomain helicase DNA binding protein 1 like n=1 Tax=Trichostrongylus colubriformis TaxID=6319 RepID=A0AAN8FI84_TRICO